MDINPWKKHPGTYDKGNFECPINYLNIKNQFTINLIDIILQKFTFNLELKLKYITASFLKKIQPFQNFLATTILQKKTKLHSR